MARPDPPTHDIQRRYAVAFGAVRDAIGLERGFVLLPVESPSEDVTRALAHSLSAAGHVVQVVAPYGKKWASVVADLARARVQGGATVVILDCSHHDDAYRRALRLLNQRRDSVVAALGCPLLWAGPKEAHRLAWEHAPDLWSVRALPIPLLGAALELAPDVVGDTLTLKRDGGSEDLVRLFNVALKQGDTAAAASIGARASRMLLGRHALREALTIATEVEGLCRRAGLDAELAEVLTTKAEIHLFASQLQKAERAVEEAARLDAPPHVRARSDWARGRLYMRTDRLKEAEEAFRDALTIFRGAKARLGEANIHRAIGDLYARTARLEEAEDAYGRALTIYHEVEDRLGDATAHRALGDLYVRTDRLKEAENAYGRALTVYRGIKVRLGEANTHKALGDLYMRTDRLKEAEDAYGRALRIYRDIESRLGEANAHKALGELYVRTDRLKEAEEAYGRALPIFRDSEDRLGEANTHRALGGLHVRMAGLKAGEAAYRRALTIYRDIEDRLGEANAHLMLGDLYVRMGRLASSVEEAEEALAFYRAIGDRIGHGGALSVLGRVALERGDLASAERRLLEALRIQTQIEDREGIAEQHVYLAATARRAGLSERAIALAAAGWDVARAIEHPHLSAAAVYEIGRAAREANLPLVAAPALRLCAHLDSSPPGLRVDAVSQLAALGRATEAADQLSADEVRALEAELEEGVAVIRERLEARGEGLFDPLPGDLPTAPPHR